MRKERVTVGKTGAADFTTINEALRSVAVAGTVTIIDAGEYTEAICVTDSQQFSGVRLLAPHRATLRSSGTAPVLRIQSVPHLHLAGLTIVAPQSQHAIEVNGECPGLRLENILIERTDNPAGSEASVAAIVMRSGVAGTAELPLVVRNLTVHSTNVGIVIGNKNVEESPPRHIVIEQCLVQGLSNQSSTALALLRQSEDVLIHGNTFAHGKQGLSILTEANALPERLQIRHNTWHDVQSWFVWSGPTPQTVTIQVHHNLIVDAIRNSSVVHRLAPPAGEPPVFENNVRLALEENMGESFSPVALDTSDFPLLSADPLNPAYLKPDFKRLRSSGAKFDPVPGRYFEADSP